MGHRRLIGALAMLAGTATTAMLAWIALWPQTPDSSSANSHPHQTSPDTPDPSHLTATLCAPSDCVLVQAGGFSFLFGAGEKAATGLKHTGLLPDRLDAVLLTGIDLDAITGLAAVRQMTWTAGRSEPLRLVGPDGTASIALGINAMTETHDAQMALESETLSFADAVLVAETIHTVSRRVVFDSGLLRITAHDGDSPNANLLYQIDYAGQTLVIAGCGIKPHIWTHATQKQNTVAIARIEGRNRTDNTACPSLPDLADALASAGVSSAWVWSRSLAGDALPHRIHTLRGVRIMPAIPGTPVRIGRQ